MKDYYIYDKEAYVNVHQLEDIINYIKEDLRVLNETKEKSMYENYVNGLRNLINVYAKYINNLTQVRNQMIDEIEKVERKLLEDEHAEMDDYEIMLAARKSILADIIKSDVNSYIDEMNHFNTLIRLHEKKSKMLS